MISAEEFKLSSGDAIQSLKTASGRKCVLVVEDDRSLRRLLEIILERSHYDFVSAADGLEAMKLLTSTSVDIVITDAIMPNLNGYELCRFIRSSESLAHLPIVLLSALDPRNDEAKQVDEFLPKPVAPEDLLACLARLIKSATDEHG
jgi:CheY-like chemotaxis protein